MSSTNGPSVQDPCQLPLLGVQLRLGRTRPMRSVCRPEANSRMNNFDPMTFTLAVVVKSWACSGRNGVINPFRISRSQTRATVLQRFAVYARAHLAHKVHSLACRRLLCHCESHQQCHGDVLIELFKETCGPWFQSVNAPVGRDVSLSSSVADAKMCSDQWNCSQSPSQPSWKVANRGQSDASIGVLILFAGLRRPNSIKNWLLRLSAQYNVVVSIADFDILNGPEHDLVDDLVARQVLHLIDEQTFQAIFMSPPCSTFTCLRSLEISSRRLRQKSV